MFILAQGFGLLTISFFGFRFPAKQNMFFLQLLVQYMITIPRITSFWLTLLTNEMPL